MNTKKMEDNIEYSVNRNIEKIKADGKRNAYFGANYIQWLCKIGYNQAAITIEKCIADGVMTKSPECKWEYEITDFSNLKSDDKKGCIYYGDCQHSDCSPCFVVLAFRYGGHSNTFPIGVFDNREDAEAAARAHVVLRGGKYSHRIYEFEFGRANDDIGHAANNRPCIEANANVSEPKGTLHDVVGQMICPECGVFMDSAGVCICGYEHQCGGRDEACMIPGCTECGMPNADSNASAIADSVHSFVGNLDIGGCTDG